MKQLRFEDYFSGVLGLYAFTSIVAPKMTTIAIILLLVVVIVGLKKKELFFSFSDSSILLILLYFIYLVGIVFAFNKMEGLKYAEYKLVMLIVPLLLSVKTKFDFTLRLPTIGLILGIIIAGILGLINSNSCYQETGWLFYCFSSSFISSIHHPSYFACYLLFAGIISWFGYRKQWIGFSKVNVLCFLVFALFFYCLCLSLAATLYLGLIVAIALVYYLKQKLGKTIAFLLLLAAPVLFYFMLFSLPGIKEDAELTRNGLVEYITDSETFLAKRQADTVIPGNQKRLIMWTITSELITEHPFGVGTGNVDYYLKAKLKKYGFPAVAEEELNPHNQYLQTCLEVGVFGLFTLLFFLFASFRLAFKRKDYLLLILVGCLAFNMLFESMLQRQSGVLFFTFWIHLLLINSNVTSSIVQFFSRKKRTGTAKHEVYS